MYVKVPENRLSLTVIESIFTDSKSIPPLVIMPGKNIIVSWFYKNITNEEIITVLSLGIQIKRSV
jgi:hypothetical protein